MASFPVLIGRVLTPKRVGDRDTRGLDQFLSPAFQLQRTTGAVSTKREYLANLPIVRGYSVSDVNGTQDGDVLVVRAVLQTDTVIDGQPFSDRPTPRLATFGRHDGKWRLVAYANFNVPK